MSKLNQYYNFSKEVLAVSSQALTYNNQDDIYHPESYLDISAKSTMLDTPIGDRFIGFTINMLNNNPDELNLSPTSLNQTDQLSAIFFIQDPIITISQPREIVRTKIKGLQGDIIEVVQNGSYEINIVGTFAGNAYWLYDVDSLKLLETVCNTKSEIEITSPYLNDIFNIYNVVIMDHKIAQSTEFTNITAIEINCISFSNENIFQLAEFYVEPLKVPSFQPITKKVI